MEDQGIKPNAPHRKYRKLVDQLVLKAIELKGRDWKAVLAFFNTDLQFYKNPQG